MSFDGRTVVVTGAGSGIGREAVGRFLAAGATVVGADLNLDGIPDGAIRREVDVSDPVAVEGLVDETVEATGRLDVICNNAGIGSTADVLSCGTEEWDAVFAVNVRGVFLGTKYALRHMLRAGRGSIVNTASVAGLVGLRDRAAYCASKGAVIALTRQVAIQHAKQGIRCNCVCPGTIDSPWVGRLLAEADDPTAARQALVDRQPVGRLGLPGEVAEAIVYLASEKAGFVTGASLVIDGGILAG